MLCSRVRWADDWPTSLGGVTAVGVAGGVRWLASWVEPCKLRSLSSLSASGYACGRGELAQSGVRPFWKIADATWKRCLLSPGWRVAWTSVQHVRSCTVSLLLGCLRSPERSTYETLYSQLLYLSCNTLSGRRLVLTLCWTQLSRPGVLLDVQSLLILLSLSQ